MLDPMLSTEMPTKIMTGIKAEEVTVAISILHWTLLSQIPTVTMNTKATKMITTTLTIHHSQNLTAGILAMIILTEDIHTQATRAIPTTIIHMTQKPIAGMITMIIRTQATKAIPTTNIHPNRMIPSRTFHRK
jgi:hypothetical protein